MDGPFLASDGSRLSGLVRTSVAGQYLQRFDGWQAQAPHAEREYWWLSAASG